MFLKGDSSNFRGFISFEVPPTKQSAYVQNPDTRGAANSNQVQDWIINNILRPLKKGCWIKESVILLQMIKVYWVGVKKTNGGTKYTAPCGSCLLPVFLVV